MTPCIDRLKRIEGDESNTRSKFVFDCPIEDIVAQLKCLEKDHQYKFSKYVFFYSEPSDYNLMIERLNFVDVWTCLEERIDNLFPRMRIRDNMMLSHYVSSEVQSEMVEITNFLNTPDGAHGANADVLFIGKTTEEVLKGFFVWCTHRNDLNLPMCVYLRRMIEHLTLQEFDGAWNFVSEKYGLNARVSKMLDQKVFCLDYDARDNASQKYVVMWALDKNIYEINTENLNLSKKKPISLLNSKFDNLMVCIESENGSLSVIKSEKAEFEPNAKYSRQNKVSLDFSLEIQTKILREAMNEFHSKRGCMCSFSLKKNETKRYDRAMSMSIYLALKGIEDDAQSNVLYGLIKEPIARWSDYRICLQDGFPLSSRKIIENVLCLAMKGSKDAKIAVYSKDHKTLGVLNEHGMFVKNCPFELDGKFHSITYTFRMLSDLEHMNDIAFIKNMHRRIHTNGDLLIHFVEKRHFLPVSRSLKTKNSNLQTYGFKFHGIYRLGNIMVCKLKKRSKLVF